jgi:HYR domain
VLRLAAAFNVRVATGAERDRLGASAGKVVREEGVATNNEADRTAPAVSRVRRMGRRVVVALATAAGAGGFLGAATASLSAETPNLRGALNLVSISVPCPAGTPDTTECRARTGNGIVPGLGNVSLVYLWSFRMGPPSCSSTLGKPLSTTGRLVIAGKGEIHFALAEGANCVDQEPLRNEPQDFTIIGGSGIYEAASGGGTVARSLSGGSGTERWTGTLVVPGLELDLTPPTFSGARSTTVRAPKGAKRVRVTYNVTARDAVDGPIPVSCEPRSGSRFEVGRTIVTCEATDTSGNTGRARFAVTVKKKR